LRVHGDLRGHVVQADVEEYLICLPCSMVAKRKTHAGPAGQ